MANRQWLERVWIVVTRAGLPTDYATRLLEELDDHVAELARNLPPGAQVEDHLGAPDAVARAAVTTYRAGTLAGRFPLVAFVLAPLVGAIVAWNLYIIAGTELVEGFGGMASAFAIRLTQVLTWLSGFVAPAFVVSVLWRVYRRSGRPLAWFATSGAIVAVLAGLFFARFTPPSTETEADLIIEFHFARSWVQALQFVTVAALAAVLGALSNRKPDRPVVAC